MKECANCKQLRPIWKRVKNNGYCQNCSKILFPTKGLKKRSAKKISEDNSYSDLRKEFLTKHPVCMAHLPGCTQQSTDVHHIRGRIGTRYLDTEDWVGLCRACHILLETNPDIGRDLGFVKNRSKQG